MTTGQRPTPWKPDIGEATRAYKNGYMAACRDDNILGCPYPEDHRLTPHWTAGWLSGLNAIKADEPHTDDLDLRKTIAFATYKSHDQRVLVKCINCDDIIANISEFEYYRTNRVKAVAEHHAAKRHPEFNCKCPVHIRGHDINE